MPEGDAGKEEGTEPPIGDKLLEGETEPEGEPGGGRPIGTPRPAGGEGSRRGNGSGAFNERTGGGGGETPGGAGIARKVAGGLAGGMPPFFGGGGGGGIIPCLASGLIGGGILGGTGGPKDRGGGGRGVERLGGVPGLLLEDGIDSPGGGKAGV